MGEPVADLRVVSIPGKGRGVLAGRRFEADELIERSPVIIIPAADWALVEQTSLSRFCFCWHDDVDDAALALGHASLFNHSYSPNAISRPRMRDRAMEFFAWRDIEEGEEITLNYKGEPDGRGPVGFVVKE